MKNDQEKISQFYNKSLPHYHFETLSLEPIVEESLGETKAKHLLSRCMFGCTKENIAFIAQLSIEQALNHLLEPLESPNPPLGIDSRDEATTVGETWVNNPYDSRANIYRQYSLNAWWIGQLLNQSISLKEKMVLFWHNLLVVKSDAVDDAGLLFQYNKCLRENALGNYQHLIEEITILPAMLQFLNGENNIASAPNENFACCLLELFTIAQGLQIANGDYTNYTENDIKEASRVLTGWQIDYDSQTATFNAENHDNKTKNFSAAFNNAEIENTGEEEYKSLIQLIFTQEKTSHSIIRKLYRWFVYYAIDEEIEANIIAPLAAKLRENNYELKPILRLLLSSQHFFTPDLQGCIIKNPVDFTIGTLKNVFFPFPNNNQFINQYSIWNYFHQQISELGTELGNPPTAAGWPANYQKPQYHQLWINAFTISQKAKLSNLIISENGISKNGNTYITDLIYMAESTSNPGNASSLINELASIFFPNSISQQQKDDLKEVLIPGLPDSEWTNEWNNCMEDPTNETQRNAVERKLRDLLQIMFKMAEYQLS